MNELQTQEKKDVSLINEKSVTEFLFSSQTKLSQQEQTMFLQLAIRNQLDPFKREIYAIKYGSTFNIVTGYQTYIKRAEQTGQLDGWECDSLRDNGKLIGAKIKIYRKDFKNPFVWTVEFNEFNKSTSTWKSMPDFMIKKVCIGQGFRLAFPSELGSLPYLAEEISTQDSQPKVYIQEPKAIEPEELNQDYNIDDIIQLCENDDLFKDYLVDIKWLIEGENCSNLHDEHIKKFNQNKPKVLDHFASWKKTFMGEK